MGHQKLSTLRSISAPRAYTPVIQSQYRHQMRSCPTSPVNFWRLTFTQDRKSTRLNSSHEWISYAVFCLKKKKKKQNCSSRLSHALRWSCLPVAPQTTALAEYTLLEQIM